METLQAIDRCSTCGMPFEDTGKKQQCRNCGMFANLCCDPQMPIDLCPAAELCRIEEDGQEASFSAG